MAIDNGTHWQLELRILKMLGDCEGRNTWICCKRTKRHKPHPTGGFPDSDDVEVKLDGGQQCIEHEITRWTTYLAVNPCLNASGGTIRHDRASFKQH